MTGMEFARKVNAVLPGERIVLSNVQMIMGDRDLASAVSHLVGLGIITELPRTGDAAKYQKLWPR